MPKFSNRITDAISTQIQANWSAKFTTEASAYAGTLTASEITRWTSGIDWTKQFVREELPDQILTELNYKLPLFYLKALGGQSNPNGPNRGILLASLNQAVLKVRWDSEQAIEPVATSAHASALQGCIESTILGIICNPATRSNFGPGISFNSIVDWQRGDLVIGESGYSATETYTFTFNLAV